MIKPVSIDDIQNTPDTDLSLEMSLDSRLDNIDDLNYATLTDALEQRCLKTSMMAYISA